MDDEFDKLMKILSLESREKEKKLDEIFQRCTEFFDKYKYIIVHGNEEEKNSIQNKMNQLREKFKEENERSQVTLGMTSEEIKKLTEDPKNFTKEQWEFLQKTKQSIMQEEKPPEKTKKKSMGKKSKWMKS